MSQWKAQPRGLRTPATPTATSVAALAQQVEALDHLVRQQASSFQRQEALIAALAHPVDSTAPVALADETMSVSMLAAPVVAAVPTVPTPTSPPGEAAVPMIIDPDPVPGYVQVGIAPESGQPIWLLGGLVSARSSDEAAQPMSEFKVALNSDIIA